jgi:transcriptional regulator with XRE-family HTH domain
MIKSVIMKEKMHLRLNRLLDLKSEAANKRYYIKDVANLFPDISEDAVRRWFRGEAEPKIEYLVKIAEYFNVSLDYLLGGRIDNNLEYSSDGVPVGRIAEDQQVFGLEPNIKDCLAKLKQLPSDKAKDLLETFIVLLDAAIAKRSKKNEGRSTKAAGE